MEEFFIDFIEFFCGRAIGIVSLFRYNDRMKEEKKNVVYLLRCRDNSLYTGRTNDLACRVGRHSEGKGAKYIVSRLPVTHVRFEECAGKEQVSGKGRSNG